METAYILPKRSALLARKIFTNWLPVVMRSLATISVNSCDGFCEASARGSSEWENHLQRSDMDASARDGWSTICNGRGPYRNRFDRADRFPQYYSAIGARVGFPRRPGPAQ